MIKKYYKIKFELISAMNIGSGENDITDKDLIRNSRGVPYIPGTTMAGIYRSIFSDKMAKKYFGYVDINRGEEDEVSKNISENLESSIMVYDSTIVSGKYNISRRDCVGLDEYKTGINGAKFDFEVLEPGVEFVTYIEQNIKSTSDDDIGLQIIKAWIAGKLSFGSKTMRGLGRTKIKSVLEKSFDLSSDRKYDWLKFDMYDWQEENDSEDKLKDIIENIQNAESNKNKDDKINILIKLHQMGGISIRRYTTAPGGQGQDTPDYEQMYYERNGKIIPYIPGTSWAGAFRHHIRNLNLVDESSLNNVFGICKKENNRKKLLIKSKILFSESEITEIENTEINNAEIENTEIENTNIESTDKSYHNAIKTGVSKIITRNAIDRFTNGTIDGALYTEKSYYGGNTTLNITLDSNVNEAFKRCLAIAIVDLHLGILAVGGLTAVGRGIFEITDITIDGKRINVYKCNNEDGTEENRECELYKEIVKCL